MDVYTYTCIHVLLEPFNSVVTSVANTGSPNYLQLGNQAEIRNLCACTCGLMLSGCPSPGSVTSLPREAKGDAQNVTQLGMEELESPNFQMVISVGMVLMRN